MINETQIPSKFREVQFPPQFPITEQIPYARTLFADPINNPIILLSGETGSGKTTSIYEIIRALDEEGITLLTEPTRVATRGAVNRMQELAPAGHKSNISYQIGGEHQGPKTRLTAMTEGVAVDDILDDPLLRGVTRIIIDEAHSEEIDTWQIMGLALRAQELRKQQGIDEPLQVILSSATLNKSRILNVTGDVPEIEAKGRMFPVKREFLKPEEKDQYMEYRGRDGYVFNYAKAAAMEAIKLLQIPNDRHDVLVFLPGMGDIEEAMKYANEIADDPDFVWESGKPLILPLTGSLSKEEQNLAVYEDTPQTKLIFATDVAEASLTPTRPVHVVTSAMANISYFDPRTGFDALRKQYLSKRRLTQQEGRAGRLEDGICRFLLTEDEYNNNLPEEILPEIHRTNLAKFVLKLRAAGLKDPRELRIPEHAAAEAYAAAEKDLVRLGAVEAETGEITKDGLRMAKDLSSFSPEWARLIIDAEENGCAMEILTIAAFCSGKNIWNRPTARAGEADKAHSKFKNPHSDFITYLDIWDNYNDVYDRAYSQALRYTQDHYYENPEKYARSQAKKAAGQWAHDNFLNGQVLGEVSRMRTQIGRRLKGVGKFERASEKTIAQTVLKALPWNVSVYTGDAYGSGKALYTHALSGESGLKIHPGSSLAWSHDEVVLALALYTNPNGVDYIRTAQSVSIEDVVRLAPDMIERQTSEIVDTPSSRVELRTYYVKTASGALPVQKEYPISPEKELEIEAAALAIPKTDISRQYEFQTQNRIIMNQVADLFLRDNAPISDEEFNTKLKNFYVERSHRFNTYAEMCAAMQAGQVENLQATLEDFIPRERVNRILAENPNTILFGETNIPVTYHRHGETVMGSVVLTTEQVLGMHEWPHIPSGKNIQVTVSVHNQLIVENGANMDHLQAQVANMQVATLWDRWKVSQADGDIYSVEGALLLQPQEYGHHPLTGEPLNAYPVITLTEKGAQIHYSNNQEEAIQARGVVEARIAELKAQETQRVELQTLWTFIQQPEEWEYVDTLAVPPGEISSIEVYLKIQEGLASGTDVLTLKDDITLLNKRIIEGKETEHLLEMLSNMSKESTPDDPQKEVKTTQEQIAQKIVEAFEALTSENKAEKNPEIISDDELQTFWSKYRYQMKRRVKEDLLTVLALRGPVNLLAAEDAINELPELIKEYRARIYSTSDTVRQQQQERILQQIVRMKSIVEMMKEYSIESENQIREFSRVLQEVLKEGKYQEVEDIFNKTIEKSVFTE